MTRTTRSHYETDIAEPRNAVRDASMLDRMVHHTSIARKKYDMKVRVE
jgi:hypothetical protein